MWVRDQVIMWQNYDYMPLLITVAEPCCTYKCLCSGFLHFVTVYFSCILLHRMSKYINGASIISSKSITQLWFKSRGPKYTVFLSDLDIKKLWLFVIAINSSLVYEGSCTWGTTSVNFVLKLILSVELHIVDLGRHLCIHGYV